MALGEITEVESGEVVDIKEEADGLVKEGFATEDTLMVVAEVIKDVAGEDEIDGVEKVDNTEGVREDDMEETVTSEGEAEFVEVSVDDASVP